MGCGPVPAIIELPQKFTPFAMFTGMRAEGIMLGPHVFARVQTGEGVVPTDRALNVLVPGTAIGPGRCMPGACEYADMQHVKIVMYSSVDSKRIVFMFSPKPIEPKPEM